jgi:type IV pilus assembly protein PilN
MIRINLLPHREERRRERQRTFLLTLAGVAVGAGAIWFVGSQYLSERISSQESRNTLLKTEITRLDKQIEEIKKLKEQTAQLLARKQVVENLQTNRSEAVKLMDQVGRIPEGLYLKSITQSGEKVGIVGYAQSNARVSALMRDLEVSPVLRGPELVKIESVTVSNQRTNEFSLNASMRQNITIDPAAATAKAAVTPPPPSAAEAARQAVMNKVSK